MAEFDSAGLSVVSAFFNVNDNKQQGECKGKQQQQSTTNTPSADNDNSSRTSTGHSRSRRGVGSTAIKPVERSLLTKEKTIGRVLKVGKRKQTDTEDELEYDRASSTHHESDNDGDSHGEEEGRTTIAKDSTKVTANVIANPPVAVKQSTTKKGKKEHQANEQASTKTTDDGGVLTFSDIVQTNDEKEQARKSKRKRRKVRSRQKNIYKDKRLSQHKPAHLIAGRPEYVGRPLTSATRSKLNLPPSRSSRRRHDDSLDVELSGEETKNELPNSEGVKLAIDDLLDQGSARLANDECKADTLPVEHSKRKQRRKSKYKNLAL